MKRLKITLLAFLILSISVGVFAQANNEALAKIGNQTLTAQDLDAQTQAVLERLPQEIAETRKQELAKEINELLFAAEAAARKTTLENLLALEVKKLVQNPTETQLQAVFDANRNAFGNATYEQVKPRLISYLRRQQEGILTTEFAEKLKAKHKIALGADVNSANLKPTDVLATVGGKQIMAASFNERLKPLEYDLRFDAFEKTIASLDSALYSNLIMAESNRARVTPEEIIRREISDKLRQPTDADAKKFYDERKAQINVDFDTAKNEILSFLAQEERTRLESALRQRLMKSNNAQILLREPEPLVLKVSVDDDPAKGNPNAAVTVVMFTDFQCPACARTHPVLTEILKNYGDKVKFVVRDFPLTDIHENAFHAAEAANAAHAQNKFFEYIEFLYQNQNAFDDASLKKYAAQAGLNAKQFETDLTSGRFAAEIRKDQLDGANYGIKGTPTIFVNGLRLNGLSAEAFRAAIEKALTKK